MGSPLLHLRLNATPSSPAQIRSPLSTRARSGKNVTATPQNMGRATQATRNPGLRFAFASAGSDDDESALHSIDILPDTDGHADANKAVDNDADDVEDYDDDDGAGLTASGQIALPPLPGTAPAADSERALAHTSSTDSLQSQQGSATAAATATDAEADAALSPACSPMMSAARMPALTPLHTPALTSSAAAQDDDSAVFASADSAASAPTAVESSAATASTATAAIATAALQGFARTAPLPTPGSGSRAPRRLTRAPSLAGSKSARLTLHTSDSVADAHANAAAHAPTGGFASPAARTRRSVLSGAAAAPGSASKGKWCFINGPTAAAASSAAPTSAASAAAAAAGGKTPAKKLSLAPSRASLTPVRHSIASASTTAAGLVDSDDCHTAASVADNALGSVGKAARSVKRLNFPQNTRLSVVAHHGHTHAEPAAPAAGTAAPRAAPAPAPVSAVLQDAVGGDVTCFERLQLQAQALMRLAETFVR